VPYFRYETWPTVLFVILKHYKISLILSSLGCNIRGVTTKQIEGTCSNIWSVAIWELFPSQTSLYFYSGLCSVLSQIDDGKCAFSVKLNCMQSVPKCTILCWTSLWHNHNKYLCSSQTLPKVGNIDSVIMCTKSNCTVSPMTYSNQCQAISWKIYRSIMRTSQLINTVYKC